MHQAVRTLEAFRNCRQANHAPVLGEQEFKTQAYSVGRAAAEAAVLSHVLHGGQFFSRCIHGSSIKETATYMHGKGILEFYADFS